jgi:HlyD family secretion protein
MKKWPIAIVVLAGCGWAIWHFAPRWLPARGGSTEMSTKIEVAQVKRQDLRVVLNESGKVRAIRSEQIYPEVRDRQLRITWLAAEGATVKKGDKIASFATDEFERARDELKGQIENAKKQLLLATEAIKIQESDGKSAIKAAETRLAEASVAYRTFRDLDAPKTINTLDKETTENRKKLAEAKAEMTEARRKLDEQLFGEEEQRKQFERNFQEARDTVRTIEGIIESTQKERKIFRQYKYPQQSAALSQAVENAELELNKARVNAASTMQQKEAELASNRETVERLNKMIEENESNITKSTLHAPVDGLVLYGDPSSGRYYGERIGVGANWYGGNVLLTIPDLSAFEVDINIPEDYRGRVSIGAKVIVTIEAIPGLTSTGTIKEVSQLGQAIGWDPTGSAPKFYATVVTVDQYDARMISGMTAKVQIVADELKDVVVVPIEGVFNDAGKPVVYTINGEKFEKRRVAVGKRNDSQVQILDGVGEGQSVSLVLPPSDKVVEIPGEPVLPVTTQASTQASTTPSTQTSDDSSEDDESDEAIETSDSNAASLSSATTQATAIPAATTQPTGSTTQPVTGASEHR